MEDKFYQYRNLIERFFNAGDFTAVEKYANEYIEEAQQRRNDWNYGNAIHHANLFLGRIALKNEKTEEAKQFLIKAGQTPGSPQLNSFGPNMVLAKELLALGEFSIVLEYLNLVATFWKSPFKPLETWKEKISKGEIPNFEANLVY